MDSSKTVDDDTIRDQMESGSVATRPRFTRARRTWKFNVRNLVAEDLRALDEFFMVTAARGGNSFLYPNLLPNGSFEFPAGSATDLVFGWNVPTPVTQLNTAVAAPPVADGVQALSISTAAGQNVPPNSTVTGQVAADPPISCAPGEVYQFTAAVNAAAGTLPAGVLSGYVAVMFFDSYGTLLSTLNAPSVALGGGWKNYGCQFAIPANAVAFAVALTVSLVNATGVAIALDSSASITWDSVGCALLTPLTPYGRMVGSQPLGCLVRFSKAPETSDVGVGAGVKRYGASLELTEV